MDRKKGEFVDLDDIMDMEKEERRRSREYVRERAEKKSGGKNRKPGTGRSPNSPCLLKSPDNIVGDDNFVADAMSGVRWLNQPPETAEELAERFNAYFYKCGEVGRVPSVAGLAVTAGVTVKTLNRWQNQEVRAGSGIGEVVEKAKTYVRYVLEQIAIDGKMPPVVYIFMGKNYFGMSDKVEQEITVHNPLTEIESGDALKERIAASIPTEFEVED